MCINRTFVVRCEELISKAAHPWLPHASADVHPHVPMFLAALRTKSGFNVAAEESRLRLLL